METRDVYADGVELREGTDGAPSSLSGYAAVFGTEAIIHSEDGTSWRETIATEAFRDAIGRDDAICAVNHDSKQVLGRTRAGSLELLADQHGLRYTVQLPNTTLAKDTIELVRKKVLTGSSFRFTVPKGGVTLVKEEARHAEGLPLLRVEKVRLIDVGPVTFPAYEGTSVSVRSTPEAVTAFYASRKEEQLSLLERAKADEAAKPAAIKEREGLRAYLDAAKAWPH